MRFDKVRLLLSSLALAGCGGVVTFDDEEPPGDGGGSADERIDRALDRVCTERCSIPACQEIPPPPVEDCARRCADFPESCLDEILAYNECIIELLCDGSICLEQYRAATACLEQEGALGDGTR